MTLKAQISTTLRKILNKFAGYDIEGLPFIRRILSFAAPFMKTEFVEIEGHKIFLDPLDSLDLSIAGVYEPFETELVKKTIKKGDIVLDIGANIGYYTLLFAKLVGPSGKVYAFEPDPINFALLSKNVRVNGYTNVKLENKAVSDKTSKAKLYLSDSSAADHVIFDDNKDRRSIDIETTSLDDYFKDFDGRIDFLKMDIQGAEGGAVKGSINLFQSNISKIFTEYYPYGLSSFGVEPKEFLDLLINAGFKIYNMDDKKRKVEPITIKELLNKYSPEKGGYTNLYCSKKIKN